MRKAMLTAIKTQQATRMPNVVDHIVGAFGSRGTSLGGGARAGHLGLGVVAVTLEHSQSSSKSSSGAMVLQ